MTDALGHVYGYDYNADGQPRVITFPAGLDSLYYDDQGRLRSQKTLADGLSGPATWSVDRDEAGRVWRDQTQGLGPTYEYDGLGHLIESQIQIQTGLWESHYFTRNRYGSAVVEQDFRDAWDFGELDPPGTKWGHSPSGDGRRLDSEEEWEYKNIPEPNGWNPGIVAYDYDDAGNAVDVYDSRYAHTYSGAFTGYENAALDTHYRSYSKSYYDAEGRLRVHQINRDSVDHEAWGINGYGDPWGAYEEYWYDALGRRVLNRSRQEDPICTYYDPPHDRCYSSIERFVWDGDQILWELRQSAEPWDSLDVKNPSSSLSGQTGHIGYVYAGGIDTPRGMIRNGTAIVLHRNWKGLTTFTTDDEGNTTTCAPSDYIGPGCSPIVSFPGASWALTQGYEGSLDVQIWYGSVTMAHQDRSGLRYQRNRYLDPSAGQFTQQDPIGIAGGLNLYGYAGGDPINFSDPFGLCEHWGDDDHDEPCVEVGLRPLNDPLGRIVFDHAAIRIRSGELDVLIELLNVGATNSVDFRVNPTDGDLARYSWTEVPTPSQYATGGLGPGAADAATRTFANAILTQARNQHLSGRRYRPEGGLNSNRFVFATVGLAGGLIPCSAKPFYRVAPGLFGGHVLATGSTCGR